MIVLMIERLQSVTFREKTSVFAKIFGGLESRPNNLLIINSADHWLKPKTIVGQRVGYILELFDRKYSLHIFLNKKNLLTF